MLVYHIFSIFWLIRLSVLYSQFSEDNSNDLFPLSGVGLIFVILRVLTFILTEKFHLKGCESGIYGTPPSLKFWMRQAAIYLVALTTMKFMVIGLLALFPGLFAVGGWLLSWTWSGDGDTLEVIL
jgi:hypothetical protein